MTTMTSDLHLNASSKSELDKALATIRRQKPACVTIRWTHNGRARGRDLGMINVPVGTILVIEVINGLPFFHVGSGRVVYRALSSWGNSIEVHGGEVHVVTDHCDRKVRVSVDPASDMDVPIVTAAPGEQEEGSRVHWTHPSHRGLPWDSRPKMPVLNSDPITGIPFAWMPDKFVRGDAVTFLSSVGSREIGRGHILAPGGMTQDDDGDGPVGEPYKVYPVQYQGGRDCAGWWPEANLVPTVNPEPPAWPID